VSVLAGKREYALIGAPKVRIRVPLWRTKKISMHRQDAQCFKLGREFADIYD